MTNTGLKADQPIVVDGVPYVIVDVDTTELGDHVVAYPADAPDDGHNHLETIAADGSVDIALVECSWFAKCDRVAYGVEPHPVLGLVPICPPCAAKVAKLRS